MKESRFYRMVYAIAALAMCLAGCTGTQEGSFDNLTETLKQYQIISVDSGYITVAGKNQITDKATGAVYTPQGLVDPEGRLVVPLEYERIVARDTWRTGVVVVSRNGKSGLADLNGNEGAACQYDAIIRATRPSLSSTNLSLPITPNTTTWVIMRNTIMRVFSTSSPVADER